MRVSVASIMVLLLMNIIITSCNEPSAVIINGPQDTTVCINTTAECDCGFIGANPNHVVPNWRIIYRRDNGDVINDVSYDGLDVAHGRINGLRWVADLNSGNNNANNSKLLVGPINMAHNQSSYQCIISSIFGPVKSSVGTMTVVDPPSVIISVDEICATSVTISLNTYSHPACGDVSHDFTIPGNVTVYPDTIGGTQYTVDKLQSDSLYNVTVISTYKSGSKTTTKTVRTGLSKSPNSINSESIQVMITDNNDVKMTWEPPLIDICTMSAIKLYRVQINSSEGETILVDTDNATFFHEHLECHSITALTVSIVVINSEGLHSDPVLKTIVMQPLLYENKTISISSPTIEPELTTNINTTTEEHSEVNEKYSKLFMILTAVFLFTSIITTAISLVLFWKLCFQQKKKEVIDVAPISPTQMQRQPDIDNIVMQQSPAYASIEAKSISCYQNI